MRRRDKIRDTTNEDWFLVALLLMAVVVFFTVPAILPDEIKKMNILGGEGMLSRDAAYQGSATIMAAAVFSSVLAFRLSGSTKSKTARKNGATLLFVGLMVVLGLQAVVMLHACCWFGIHQGLMLSLVLGTFIGLMMFGLGIFKLVKVMLEEQSDRP